MTDKKYRLLVIDDEKEECNIVIERLRRRNFECDYYTSFLDFEKTGDLLSYDAVLLDIMMPDISGVDVLLKIRSIISRTSLPVIMVTALDETDGVISAFKNGANDFVTKPVNIDVAVARVLAHIENCELHKELIVSREIDAIKNLVTTYGHEINNPLSICIIHARNSLDEMTVDGHKKLLSSLERIKMIVKKIDKVSQGQLNTIAYDNQNKMFNLKEIK